MNIECISVHLAAPLPSYAGKFCPAHSRVWGFFRSSYNSVIWLNAKSQQAEPAATRYLRPLWISVVGNEILLW
jgi:hypothetical protein